MADTGIFYGTGAAEGVPSPFCDCPMCNYAREHGGKDVRKRSCFRLGRNIMIDMGPDIFTQALQYGSMCDIEHVLITHTHDDHFDFTALGLMSMATHLRTTPVHFYFSEEGYPFHTAFLFRLLPSAHNLRCALLPYSRRDFHESV